VGGTHLIDREVLLEFLDQTIAADDVSGAVRLRREEAAPPPQPKRMKFSLPGELKSVMAADLPENIELMPGRLSINGRGSEEIIEALFLLAQALQNDLGTIQGLLDPLPERPQVADSELRRLFAGLELTAGDTLRAQKNFMRAIAIGLDDENAVLEWCRDLVAAGRPDLAEPPCAAWEAKFPTLNARRWHAEVIRERGDTTRAIALLRTLHDEHPGDLAVDHELASTLLAHGDADSAGGLAERVLQEHADDEQSLLVLGRSQLARRRYREAKTTLEPAARLYPDDALIAQALRRASSALGEGDHANTTAAIEPVPLPAEIAAAAAQPPPADFGHGFPGAVLTRILGYAIEPGKPIRRTLYERTRVLTQAGAASEGTREFTFHPAWERIFVNRVEVRDSTGGPVITSSADDAYVIDAKSDAADGSKVLHVPVQGVHPGCTIELQVSWQYLGADSPFDVRRMVMADFRPVALVGSFVSGDTSRVRGVLTHGEDVSRVRREGLTAWLARPAYLEHRETRSTRIEDRAPVLLLATAEADWAQSARAYLTDIRDLMEPTPAITALATRLTAGATDEHERIARLARYVQQQIQYRAVEFGPRARRPQPADKVLAQRSGDCKDQAVLLHQLLTSAGVGSQLALVNSSWRIEPSLPTLDQFDHMVVHVPALGPDWLLDPTDKTLQLDALPAAQIPSHALLLAPSNPRLLPPAGPPRTGVDVRVRTDAHAEGADWVVRDSLTLTGYMAAWMRAYFRGLSESDRSEAVMGMFEHNSAVQLRNVEVGELEDTSVPMTLSLDYSVRNAITTVLGRTTAEPPCQIARGYLGAVFVNDRHNAFELNWPIHLTDDLHVHLPAAPVHDGAASPDRGEGPFCLWKLRRETGPTPGDLALHLEFTQVSGTFGPERYREFQAAQQAPLDALGRRLEW